MFTGIVEELAKIQRITQDKVIIECKTVLDGTKIGDSIAVNGICLTVCDIGANTFSADISPETLRVAAPFSSGDYVNLERAMRADGRFGGHIVSGHVDGKGRFLGAVKQGSFYNLTIELPPEIVQYAVYKGSIAVNGISLTIANINKNLIDFAIIPHTFENTNLKFLQKNDFLNLEADILAKYVEKFLSSRDNRSRLDLDFLSKNGFLS